MICLSTLYLYESNNLTGDIMGGFKQIFKDSNDYNEKTIIGFMSFAVMTLAMVVDLVTGYFGNELKLNEYIYNSFVIVTLGSLGIAGLEKFAGKKSSNENNEEI
jgi:small-conductance mechanosensitive channel